MLPIGLWQTPSPCILSGNQFASASVSDTYSAGQSIYTSLVAQAEDIDWSTNAYRAGAEDSDRAEEIVLYVRPCTQAPGKSREDESDMTIGTKTSELEPLSAKDIIFVKLERASNIVQSSRFKLCTTTYNLHFKLK